MTYLLYTAILIAALIGIGLGCYIAFNTAYSKIEAQECRMYFGNKEEEIQIRRKQMLMPELMPEESDTLEDMDALSTTLVGVPDDLPDNKELRRQSRIKKQKKKKEKEESINLRKRINQGEDFSMMDFTCECEGTDKETTLKERRKASNQSYEILKRKEKKPQQTKPNKRIYE